MLDTLKSDVMSLDYQNGAALNVEKDRIHLSSLQSYEEKWESKTPSLKKISSKTEPTDQKPSVKHVKQEDVLVKQELSSNAPKSLSVYLCPIPNCNFSTSKEGMKTSKAALHLKKEHKIRAVDMKPGMYKFSKVKM